MFAKRHSYRGPFRDEPVPREHLRRIVEAGLLAPSGENAQTTTFVIVDDPAIVRAIASMPYNKAMQQAKEMARKAGVEEWSPNQLRHWVATVTAEEHDFDTAAAVMGHERPDTTVIYVAQQLRKAARRAAKDG